MERLTAHRVFELTPLDVHRRWWVHCDVERQGPMSLTLLLSSHTVVAALSNCTTRHLGRTIRCSRSSLVPLLDGPATQCGRGFFFNHCLDLSTLMTKRTRNTDTTEDQV